MAAVPRVGLSLRDSPVSFWFLVPAILGHAGSATGPPASATVPYRTWFPVMEPILPCPDHSDSHRVATPDVKAEQGVFCRSSPRRTGCPPRWRALGAESNRALAIQHSW